MKSKLLLLCSMSLLLVACDQNRPAKTTTTDRSTTTDRTTDRTDRNTTDRSSYDSTNTARNRDHQLTADDQPENEADRRLTKKIRQTLMDDDKLSVEAKNIKVISVNGKVTLKGVVNNEDEKSRIESSVKNISGIESVNNQLEIKK